MAHARVNLKYFKHTVNLLARELEIARGRGASQSAERDIATLYRKLTKVQKLMASECPDLMFRNFDISER